MDISYRKKKDILPSVIVDETDIPKGLALKDLLFTEGWRVYQKLYEDQRDELISSIKAAVMLKENDREIALKSAILMGFDACFGMVKAIVDDVDELMKETEAQNVPEPE